MQGVTLSKAVRQNLQAMQSTAKMMSETQNHLATGKRVNSALDNPTNFFTASALDSRASDLGNLMDSVGNAVQTLQAADNGVKAITKLVEAAQGTARQALQATKAEVTTGPSTVGDDVDTQPIGVSSNVLSGLTGDLTITTGVTVADGTGGTANSIDVAGRTLDQVATDISALTGLTATVVAGTNDGEFKLNIVNSASGGTDGVHIAEDGGDAAAILGITKASDTAAITLSTTDIDQNNVTGTSATDVASLTGSSTLIFDVDGTSSTLNLDGSESYDDIAALITDIDGLTGAVSAGANAGEFKITVTGDTTVTAFTGSGSSAAALGLDGAPGTAAVTTPNETRKNLETEFNDLLTQIDQLTKDASFNGNNFLTGDNLKVTFNEDATSTLTIKGADVTSSGLSLAAEASGNFQDNAKIDTTLKSLDKAMETLRSTSSTFGSNLSVVQTRQDFTENMINTLQEGASNLTMADLNQEGANMLALQTRQSLATTAMSMASRADQSVLSLLR